MRKKIPIPPYALSPDDAAARAGVSRSRIYELKDVEIPSRNDGRRTLFLTADVDAWVDHLPLNPKRDPNPSDPPQGRKRAQRQASGPLLPEEEQERAIVLGSEPQLVGESPAIAASEPAPTNWERE